MSVLRHGKGRKRAAIFCVADREERETAMASSWDGRRERENFSSSQKRADVTGTHREEDQSSRERGGGRPRLLSYRGGRKKRRKETAKLPPLDEKIKS